MHAAVDAGVTFFDTADVYGDGRSERLIGRLLRRARNGSWSRPSSGGAEAGSGPLHYENLRGWLERSRENLGVDSVDLVQLHCPPWETYYLPEVHEACARLVQEGLVRAYGVSVEKVEQAQKAIEYDGVATVQLIFNMLRQRPAELFFDQARQRDVGVIVRVPLASGLLTGKFDRDTTFDTDDHREYNRHGEQFDRGETFSGVDYEVELRWWRSCAARPSGCDAGPARAALDPRLRRVSTASGREDPGAGPRERRCCRSARTVARHDAADCGDLP